MTSLASQSDRQGFVERLQEWGRELGFQQLGVSNTELSEEELRLQDWLDKGYQGDMAWMGSHGVKRSRPALLHEGTRSVISVRMDYLPTVSTDSEMVLNHPELAYISRYALGRDYHKVLKKKLQQLALQIQDEIGAFGFRVFVDSAPVLEKPIAVKAGLGWVGKHSKWFFIGEIYVDLELPETGAVQEHCGSCTACIDVCPTQAIVAPYVVDATRCISYLTIELKGAIPLEFREAIGNRIYGCDDCQLICPWNRFAQQSDEPDYVVRHQLDSARLLDLFAWSEPVFLDKMQGSAIRRIGYTRWQRNIAVALGNAPYHQRIITALMEQRASACELVAEHIDWALDQQKTKSQH